MIEYLKGRRDHEGPIRASEQWLPACSFVEDTCEKLIELATIFPTGLYQLDSNEHWNLFEIATALNAEFQFNWKIEATSDYEWDSRMIDDRTRMPSLNKRLTGLGKLSA